MIISHCTVVWSVSPIYRQRMYSLIKHTTEMITLFTINVFYNEAIQRLQRYLTIILLYHGDSTPVRTHLATTSIGTPNTPELSMDGFRLMEAMLVKYSRMRVMVP